MTEKRKKKLNKLSDDELMKLSLEQSKQKESKHYKAIEKQERVRQQKKLRGVRGDS